MKTQEESMKRYVFSLILLVAFGSVFTLSGAAQTTGGDQGTAQAPPSGQGDKGTAQAPSGQVQAGQKIDTRGLILTRDGETMTVSSDKMGKMTVVLTETTKVQTPKGIFRHNNMEVTSLIPGLQIELRGVGDANGQVVADNIRFNKESLDRAKQIHAAMTGTNAQVAENQKGIASNAANISTNAAGISANAEDIKAAEQRFDNLTDWDVKKDVTLNFETGKSDLSDQAKQELVALAKDTQGMKGYMIEVKGFASASGDAARNQQLSADRSEAVTDFLHQQGVAMKNIVNPAAMGTLSPVASNDTEAGRMQNQRVEVKLLVNKGLASK
jgi:OmpA-OmpF porin, OOP family